MQKRSQAPLPGPRCRPRCFNITVQATRLLSACAPVLCAVLTMTLASPMSGAERQGQASVQLSVSEWTSRKLTSAGPNQGRTLRERQFRFHLGSHHYAVRYKAASDEQHKDRVFPVEGYIGMPMPNPCNWYHSGFLFVLLDGRDIGSTPVSSVIGTEHGPRGIADMVWRHELADVRVRFLGMPGQDRLLCEVAVDPVKPLTSITLKLRCYPSFFTAWHKRTGARRIRTPSALIEEGERTTMPASENWWSVYYDEVFDVAKGEGSGPCAMLLLPDEATDIHFAPGSYAVETTVNYPPDRRRLHLAFWDFNQLSNAEALANIQSEAERVRQELADMDFTPTAATQFDARAVLADIERTLASEGARKLLGPKTEVIRNWIKEQASILLGDRATDSIRAEETLLRSMDEYHQFMWEVKLAELVSGI